MAHTFSATTRFTGASNPVSSAITCAAGVTVLVVGIVVAGSTNRQASAPTYNGVALTQADQVQKYSSSPETNCELWYLLSPPTGSSYTLSIPNSGSQTLYVNASRFISATGRSVLNTSNGATGLSTNPTCSVTTNSNGCAIVAVCGDGLDTAPTAQNGTNMNRTDDGAYSDNNQYYLQATAGARASSWTCTSDDWCECVAAFAEASNPALGINVNENLQCSEQIDCASMLDVPMII